ncbi:putative (S)-ureidoglycine aminohydrolase, cupin-3 domain, rmlC-like cupin domain superfamily [Helianthus annuus]|nr:putative (S)-ureidoglycine aminohydrolase, cupin-3 domain, rmlC-like cupin domain superfamily [Helianthus annuus]
MRRTKLHVTHKYKEQYANIPYLISIILFVFPEGKPDTRAPLLPNKVQNHITMASLMMGPPLASFSKTSKTAHKTSNSTNGRIKCVQRPLEEIYNIRVEKSVSKQRLTELGVSKWSTWKTGKCNVPWDWHVDQLVYIEEGEVRVVPEGSERYMSFVAGDLVRYPKWFEADLWFNGYYQERYSFRAYGDD